MGHHEKTKPKNNMGRKRRSSAHKHRKCIQQNHRRKLSQPKERSSFRINRRINAIKKNYRQLRNAETGGNSVLQGRAYQLVIQYQMIRNENTYKASIIHSEQVVVIDLGIYIHTHIYSHRYSTIINNRGHEFERDWAVCGRA